MRYGFTTGRSRVPERYPIPGSIWAPIAFFRIQIPSSNRARANLFKKYRLKRLFSKTERFKPNKIDKKMGFYGLCNFGIDSSPKSAKKAAGCPPTPLYWGHLGESGYFTGSVWALKRWSIPGSIRAPITCFMILFLDSSGSVANTDGKYRFKRLFLEKNCFNRDLTVQFSGLLRAL